MTLILVPVCRVTGPSFPAAAKIPRPLRLGAELGNQAVLIVI